MNAKTISGKVYPFHKLVSVCLSICLLLMESQAYAMPLSTNPSSRVPASRLTPQIDFSIPAEFGTIEESHEGTSGQMIIYIQDAHDSLEAQENIAKIIDHVVENYGVKTVFEEGYEGPVPTDDYFGHIKDSEIRERVSYFLMDKLRLGGAEYAHINRTKDFELIGADSIQLHAQNIKAYQDSAKHKEETDKDLAALGAQIKKLADMHFPKELKEWMRLKRRFDGKQIQLLDYIKRTRTLLGGNSESSDGYPMMNLLLAAERSNDSEAIKRVKAVDAKAIFEEINRLENNLAEHFLEGKRDREIFHYWRGIKLLKRLHDITITSEEYEAVKETLRELSTQALAKFVVDHTNQSLVLSKQWEENIQNAIRFYEMAQARDQVIG